LSVVVWWPCTKDTMFNTLKVISQDMGLILYFTYRLKYKQTKYGENMTETSSKSVLRSTTIMFLFVGLFGIWMGGHDRMHYP